MKICWCFGKKKGFTQLDEEKNAVILLCHHFIQRLGSHRKGGPSIDGNLRKDYTESIDAVGRAVKVLKEKPLSLV